MNSLATLQLKPKAVIESFFAVNCLAETAHFLAENVIVTDWLSPYQDIRGRQAVLKDIFIPWDRAFSEASFDVIELHDFSNAVLVDAVFCGIFTSDYRGIAAHGRPVVWKLRDLYEVHDGLITRMSLASDTLELARALGLVEGGTLPWLK